MTDNDARLGSHERIAALNARRLNVGSGRVPLPGFVNVDLNPGPGVLYGDLNGRLPLDDGSFDFIQAHHVLEHVADFDHSMRELARVAKPGARVEIRVPYGLKSLLNPWHLRPFDLTTFPGYLSPGGCAQGNERPQWRLIEQHRLRPLPFLWHLRKYLPRMAHLIDPMRRRGDELYVLLAREANA